jgi:hypothetical protein
VCSGLGCTGEAHVRDVRTVCHHHLRLLVRLLSLLLRRMHAAQSPCIPASPACFSTVGGRYWVRADAGSADDEFDARVAFQPERPSLQGRHAHPWSCSARRRTGRTGAGVVRATTRRLASLCGPATALPTVPLQLARILRGLAVNGERACGAREVARAVGRE